MNCRGAAGCWGHLPHLPCFPHLSGSALAHAAGGQLLKLPVLGLLWFGLQGQRLRGQGCGAVEVLSGAPPRSSTASRVVCKDCFLTWMWGCEVASRLKMGVWSVGGACFCRYCSRLSNWLQHVSS